MNWARDLNAGFKTIEKLLAEDLEFERTAVKTYHGFAERIEDSKIKEMFQSLAGDENGHTEQNNSDFVEKKTQSHKDQLDAYHDDPAVDGQAGDKIPYEFVAANSRENRYEATRTNGDPQDHGGDFACFQNRVVKVFPVQRTVDGSAYDGAQ